jgi:hypothetical protein
LADCEPMIVTLNVVALLPPLKKRMNDVFALPPLPS